MLPVTTPDLTVPEETASSHAPAGRAAPMHGPALLLARGGWAALTGVALTLLFTALADGLAGYQRGDADALEFLSRALSAGGYVLIGMLVFWRVSRERMALLFSGMLIALGATTFARPEANLAADALSFTGWALLILCFFLFPNGRFVPRWSSVLAVFYIAQEFVYTFLPESPLSVMNLPGPVGNLVWLSVFVTGFGAQLYRYRRAGPLERQQSKWVVFGLGVMVAGALLLAVLPELIAPELAVLGKSLFNLVALTLPLSIAVAVTRYRLWDLTPLVNRALVLLALSVLLACVYVLVVATAERLVAASQPSVNALGAVAVALVFGPLRGRLQTLVNRLMYGERDDPYAVLTRISERVQGSVSPEEVLEPLTRTVRDALKLPFAALELDAPARQVVLGTPGAAQEVWPLVHQNEELGRLRLGRRDPDEPFSREDRRLIGDLARQAAAVAHGARLSAALQASRERLVTALEDERRRLRRDLHDGLGPQLVAITLQAGALKHLIERDPQQAARQVDELRHGLREAVADIRRLVYGLRPPTLDELGLAGAIREHAARCSTPSGDSDAPVHVQLSAPEQLPPLPAAVEVAAYRVVQEALTNVLRHAGAQHASVELWVDEALYVRVTDDGVGLQAGVPFGVGLRSMRERAGELGGSCEVRARAEGGTEVSVSFPLKPQTAGVS